MGDFVALEYENKRAESRVAWTGEAGTRMAGCAGLESVYPQKDIFAIELPPPTTDTFDVAALRAASASGALLDRRVEERRQREHVNH